jgi:endonuclease-3
LTSAAEQTWKRSSARRVRAVRERLRLVYGTPSARPHGHPIAELVLTVLSQSTNDRNRDVAYLRLRERFSALPRARHPASPDRAGAESSGSLPRARHPASPDRAGAESSGCDTWRQIRDAPVEEIEEAIRPGGISNIKSARIKAILQAITETAPEHELWLDWLADCSVPQAQAYLCSLPGVGRKTAACVLLFALGMRDVPVDTHVSRVGTRLGLFRPGARFLEMHDELLAITPRGAELELHMNLLRHGRRTCHARRPECGDCALARICPSANLLLSH